MRAMPHAIRRVAVVGAGTMGAGIAQSAALAGIEVRLHDASPEALARGLERASAQMDEGVRRGKVDAARRDAAVTLLAGSASIEDALAGADLVIEAVPEVLDLKKSIFAMMARHCPAPAILASNTSSLPIGTISADLSDRARVLGLHFFNPPHIMKLVEIVRTDATSGDVVETARTFVEALGKTAIIVRDSPGFATSRLGLVLGLEAMRMLEQGVASAADIDRAMELGYGHPMGPLKVSDLVGLDVRLSIAEILHRELSADHFRPPEILRRLVAEGKLGRKSGEGFHRWDDAKKPAGS